MARNVIIHEVGIRLLITVEVKAPKVFGQLQLRNSKTSRIQSSSFSFRPGKRNADPTNDIVVHVFYNKDVIKSGFKQQYQPIHQLVHEYVKGDKGETDKQPLK